MNVYQLDAIKTQKGNYLVFFHNFYAAYFNAQLDSFCSGEKPWREEATKEWEWALDNWEDPKVTTLNPEQSEKLITLVEQDSIKGVENIRKLVEEEYSQYAE